MSSTRTSSENEQWELVAYQVEVMYSMYFRANLISSSFAKRAKRIQGIDGHSISVRTQAIACSHFISNLYSIVFLCSYSKRTYFYFISPMQDRACS